MNNWVNLSLLLPDDADGSALAAKVTMLGRCRSSVERTPAPNSHSHCNMAAVPETTLNWLYSVLTSVIRPSPDIRLASPANARRAQNYTDVNRTYHDAAEALSHYPSLAVHTEVYSTPPRWYAARTQHA